MMRPDISFDDKLVCEDSDPHLAASWIQAILDAVLVILEGNVWSCRQSSPDR